MLDRQALTNQLLDYLQTPPEPPDYLESPPEALDCFDPYQMVGEWIALRQEIKQQNKLVQASQVAWQQALDQSPGPTPTAEKPQEDLSLLKDLLSVLDALDQAINHSQSQITELNAARAIVKPQSFWATTIWAKVFPAFFPSEPCTLALTESLSSNQAGIEMIRRSLLTILRQRQIRPMESLGQSFDGQFMYAIAQQPSDSVPANTVLQEVVRGYWQGDRIFREAQVIVASQPTNL